MRNMGVHGWLNVLRAAHLEPRMMSHECCAGSDKGLKTTTNVDMC